MGILYEQASLETWAVWLFVLFTIMAFNEFARASKWGGIALFIVVPIVLTFAVWPTTAAPGNEFGTGTWFNWVKTYSALAGVIGFMVLRYNKKWQKNKYALAFPAVILAVNIFEACLRDFQVFFYNLPNGGVVDNLFFMTGPWNIMNGIAGLLNIVAICGWAGIIISKDKSKDMVWPDMIWVWIIAYDIWNFAYVYNCITDHSIYAGLMLLLACTIPAFFIKKGAWLQHRAQTLSLWIMFVMTVPQFADRMYPVHSTRNPVVYFTISLLALLINTGLVAYQFKRIKERKLNPLKDEIYTDTKDYKQIIIENS
jgi:hypothetical protein